MSRFAGAGYFIGLGANLAPEKNVASVLELLLQSFDELAVSRIVYTEPVGIASVAPFVNCVLFVPTRMPASVLKAHCNAIEIALGRDRAHPLRKLKDRPADLDILQFTDDVSALEHMLVDECYLRPLANELLSYLQNRPFAVSGSSHACIYMKAMLLGESPATIYCDYASGLIRVD